MADILFQCSGCSMCLSAADEFIGVVFSCPACEADVQVPVPVMDFACPTCEADMAAPYSVRSLLFGCPACETEMRLPENLTFRCTSCRTPLELPEDQYRAFAGQPAACPQCGVDLVVPPWKPELAAAPLQVAEAGATAATEEALPLEESAESVPDAAPPGREPASGVQDSSKTMKLDEMLETIPLAHTLEEGMCPYCNLPLQQLHKRAYLCRRCDRVIRTVRAGFR
jgi:hypothetical protein